MSIGENIKFFRKEASLTQVELAEMIGVKQYVIARYESDQRSPTPETLLEIAEILKVDINELLGKIQKSKGKEKPPKNSRITQMQEVFKELKTADQRAILKQAKALLK